jgi:hypothetical protein
MLNERPIPDGALRDKNAIEMLRIWDAERQIYCSIRIGTYHESMSMNIRESRAWGVILADVTRYLAQAIETAYSDDRTQVIQEIRDSYLDELDSPTSDAAGEFVRDTELPGDQNAQ